MDYKKEIIKLISEIKSDKALRILYNFVNSFYKEERAGE